LPAIFCIDVETRRILAVNIEIDIIRIISGGMNMAVKKKEKAKSIAEQVSSQGKIYLLTSVAVGLVMSAVYVLITGRYVEALLVLATAIITSQVMRIANGIMIRRISRKFEEELNVIKQGDYSRFLDPNSFGVLSGIGSSLNSVLSDIRSLIDSFFSLSHSIIQASRRSDRQRNRQSPPLPKFPKQWTRSQKARQTRQSTRRRASSLLTSSPSRSISSTKATAT